MDSILEIRNNLEEEVEPDPNELLDQGFVDRCAVERLLSILISTLIIFSLTGPSMTSLIDFRDQSYGTSP